VSSGIGTATLFVSKFYGSLFSLSKQNAKHLIVFMIKSDIKLHAFYASIPNRHPNPDPADL